MSRWFSLISIWRDRKPLKERLQIGEDMTYGCLVASVTTEAIKGTHSLVVRSLGECFHCPIIHLAGAHLIGSSGSRSTDRPCCARHDVVATHITSHQLA